MGTPTCAYQQQQHAHHGQRRLGAREPDWQLCKHHPLRLDLRCEQLRLCTQGKQHPQRSLRGLRLGCPQHRREVVGPVGECSRISQTGLSVLGHGYAVLREIPSIPRKLWPPRPCCFLVEIVRRGRIMLGHSPAEQAQDGPSELELTMLLLASLLSTLHSLST